MQVLYFSRQNLQTFDMSKAFLPLFIANFDYFVNCLSKTARHLCATSQKRNTTVTVHCKWNSSGTVTLNNASDSV